MTRKARSSWHLVINCRLNLCEPLPLEAGASDNNRPYCKDPPQWEGLFLFKTFIGLL